MHLFSPSAPPPHLCTLASFAGISFLRCMCTCPCFAILHTVSHAPAPHHFIPSLHRRCTYHKEDANKLCNLGAPPVSFAELERSCMWRRCTAASAMHIISPKEDSRSGGSTTFHYRRFYIFFAAPPHHLTVTLSSACSSFLIQRSVGSE